VAKSLTFDVHDVSEVFGGTQSSMVSDGLSSGSLMMALPLKGLLGHLGTKAHDEEGAQLPRLGRELAGAAKLAGVKGIFHADELPAYGITDDEVKGVRHQLNLGQEDAFVLCCAPEWQANLALEAALNRARLAWHRIPQEVRNVVVKKGAPEDGTTSPMRPLPGRSRMYPETDVPPQRLTPEDWEAVVKDLPMSDAQRAQRLSTYEMSVDQSQQLLARELDDLFCEHAAELPPKAWAALLLNHDTESPETLANILTLREDGALARDHVEGVVEAHRGQKVGLEVLRQHCIEHDLAPADIGGLEEVIQGIVNDRLAFVQERGMGAMGPLMGTVMQAAGGADGKEVSALLRAAIQAVLE
jgi:glutamyl-tRNA(Gln) amidotransferase subunit E